MYKILLDSDALIKLTKTHLMEAIVDEFNTIITKEVYEETVEEGKRKLYFDAEVIESYIEKELINVVEVSKQKGNKKFGKGELSLLEVKNKDVIIVSDDLTFTKYCRKKGIDIMSPAHFIPILLRRKTIPKIIAKHSLKNMERLITKEYYKKIKQETKELIE